MLAQEKAPSASLSASVYCGPGTAPLARVKTCLQHAHRAGEAARHAVRAGAPSRSLETGLCAPKSQLNSCTAAAQLAQLRGCLLNHGNREGINKHTETVREQAVGSVLTPLLPTQLLITVTPLGHPSAVSLC